MIKRVIQNLPQDDIRTSVTLKMNSLIEAIWLFWWNPNIKPIFHFRIRTELLSRKCILNRRCKYSRWGNISQWRASWAFFTGFVYFAYFAYFAFTSFWPHVGGPKGCSVQWTVVTASYHHWWILEVTVNFNEAFKAKTQVIHRKTRKDMFSMWEYLLTFWSTKKENCSQGNCRSTSLSFVAPPTVIIRCFCLKLSFFLSMKSALFEQQPLCFMQKSKLSSMTTLLPNNYTSATAELLCY